jgi:hypothetical protein
MHPIMAVITVNRVQDLYLNPVHEPLLASSIKPSLKGTKNMASSETSALSKSTASDAHTAAPDVNGAAAEAPPSQLPIGLVDVTPDALLACLQWNNADGHYPATLDTEAYANLAAQGSLCFNEASII